MRTGWEHSISGSLYKYSAASTPEYAGIGCSDGAAPDDNHHFPIPKNLEDLLKISSPAEFDTGRT